MNNGTEPNQQMYSISSGIQCMIAYTGIRVVCYQKLSKALYYGLYQSLAISISSEHVFQEKLLRGSLAVLQLSV